MRVRIGIALSMISVAACWGRGQGHEEALGSATAELKLVPVDVKCIELQVYPLGAPGNALLFHFDVPPEGSTTFRLNGLPLGTDVFSASAYTVPCASAVGVTPPWTCDPVQALVAGDAPVTVTLVMNPAAPAAGGAVVGVDFPSGTPRNVVTEFTATAAQRIAPGPDGNLWFAESLLVNGVSSIGRIAPDGTLTELALPAGDGALGVAAGPDGNLWFTDYRANHILRITPGGALTAFPLQAGAVPGGIVAGPDGNLWFTEFGTRRIGRITPAGEIDEFPATSSASPAFIAAGADGNLWFTQSNTGASICRITLAGEVTEFPLPAGSDAYDIAAGPDGNLWFTEAGERIGRITPAGAITEFPIGTGAVGIAAGPDGNLWFTQTARIGRITPSGQIAEFGVPSGNHPNFIAAAPDGNVWFTETSGNIGRITP
jgi:streptogramin lyase